MDIYHQRLHSPQNASLTVIVFLDYYYYLSYVLYKSSAVFANTNFLHKAMKSPSTTFEVKKYPPYLQLSAGLDQSPKPCQLVKSNESKILKTIRGSFVKHGTGGTKFLLYHQHKCTNKSAFCKLNPAPTWVIQTCITRQQRTN